MDVNKIEELFEQLKNGEIEKIEVGKDEFMDFRSVLVKREDFKHFQGIAHIGGSVTYKYLEIPRS